MEIIVGAIEERKVKSGDVVIKQGDLGNELYIVESGTFTCVRSEVDLLLT